MSPTQSAPPPARRRSNVVEKTRPVEIVLTPSGAQYAELVRGLEILRKAGARSNTEAILSAVRTAAARLSGQ